MASDRDAHTRLHPPVRSESDLLGLARYVAARSGDQNPQLIEHTIGTREAATKTTGSWVSSDRPSYLVAIRGRFTARRRRPPLPPELASALPDEDFITHSVLVLVIDAETGRITDSGGSNDYPALLTVGPVVTDFRAPPA